MKKSTTSFLYKFLLTVSVCLFIHFRPAAQSVTNYSFGSTNGTFTALSGGNTTTWTGSTDDAISALIPIGFDFWYMGTRYTTLSASTNGWFSFDAVPSDNAYTNNLPTGGTNRPVIAPLWDDLSIGANSNVTYTTTGTAGSRVFTLQYLNTKWNYLASSSGISFQVKLYETSGKIEFIYRSESGALNSASASIGITAAATGSGNFLSVNNNGNSVSSTTENTVTAKPGSGKTYTFTSPVPTAPGSLSFTAVSNSGMTLNWSDLSTNERGFVIYRSTDGVNYNFVSQVPANTTSSVQTGLTVGTTYYWKVYAVAEGALSTALSGSRTANCTTPSAPVVTSPLNYCLNASAGQLTATGTNLLWGGSFSGAAGGNSELTTATYVEDPYNNKKTNFTTNAPNVTITSVDYYIPAWLNATGVVLGIFNNSGTVIATSTTNTTQTASSTPVLVRNVFNYNIAVAGNYSIGLVSGKGNIGSDSPAFPITESTGTVTVTGVSVSGSRCFNNIQFTYGSSTSLAPVPSTAVVGSTQYQVTQTVNGCTSTPATITVNVSSTDISQIPATNLIARYPFTGNANDATATNNGTLQNSPALTTDRYNIANQAYSFDGSSQYISTAKAYTNPGDFTISIWFRTASTTGGKLIGFGREQTGSSGQYDRHLYMNNAGQVYFGIYSGTVITANSELAYNDNNWHLATATLSSSAGMTLYIDGQKVAANAAGTGGENYTGYWRIGYDNVSGWTSQPTNFYFNGKLDDALIYDRAISAAEVAVLYTSPDGAGNNGPVCSGSPVALSAATVSGATYSWTGPNGFSSSLQNPTFIYSPAAAGIYTLTVAKSGCSATAYTNVVSASVSGQWTGSVSTDWANAANWCAGVVPTSSTNVMIPATAVRMPVISSDVYCRDLLIPAGASLAINAGGILNIAGALNNSGTLSSNGTTNFNGTSGQQTFSGVSSFYNLTVSNASGVLLPAGITVSNNLTLSSGMLDANNSVINVSGNWINNASMNAFAGGSGSVRLTGATAQEISGTFTTTFNNLTVANSAGTVSLKSNISINGDLRVSQGTLDLGSYTANRVTAGGVLTVSNNAVLKIGGNNTFPVNYTTNTLVVASTVEYSGTGQAVAAQTYGNLKLSSATGTSVKTFPSSSFNILGDLISVAENGTAVSFTAASAININGNVSIGAATTFNGGNFTHTISGNWVNNGVFNGNGSTIVLAGTATTAGGTGSQLFNHLTIAAPQISLSNTSISLTGNLATTGSGSFSQSSGGTLTMSGTGATISGSGIVLDNLSISGSVSTASSFEIKGNLTINGSFSANAGSVTMSGASKMITGAGSKTFNMLSVPGAVITDAGFTIRSGLVVNGSFSATAGSATFTGSSTLSGVANLYDVIINGTYLQLSSNSTLGIANSMTINAGILDVTSFTPNTVVFNGTGNQQVNAVTYHNLTLSNGGNKTAAGNITVRNNIRIMNATAFIAGAFTHSIYHDWINEGSFTAGTGTIEFLGNAVAYISGATTFNNLTINTTVEAETILQSNISAATVNMTSGRLLTKDKTLTISVTRTGDGIILGNIHRSHSFSAGVAYAFESPYNTILFSSVSGVTDVTVSVSIPQAGVIAYGYAVNRQYDIAIPAGTYNATLRLHYEDNELNGNDESAIAMVRNEGADWINVGKTGNSTTDNYVEHSGLTNISYTWVLSSVISHVRWNGSVSSDWHTAANWTVVEGAPSRPPSSSDIVDLGTDAFVNQPVISGTATARSLHFGSTQAVNLTLTGGSLTVSGNVEGDWSATAIHTIDAGNQTVNINGSLALSEGSVNQFIDLRINNGTVNVVGSVTQGVGAGIYFTGSGNLNISGDYVNDRGVFQGGSGTVKYFGNINQHLAHVSYNNLVIQKTAGVVQVDSIATVIGDFSVVSGEITNNGRFSIQGDATIAPGAVVNNNDTIHIEGDWNNNGSFNDNGIVIFEGSGAQTISASIFNNLTINKTVGSVATVSGDLQISGDVNVVSGTYNLQSFANNRTAVGGALVVGDSSTVIVSGNNPPQNFSVLSISKFSTLIFDGVIPQMIGDTKGGFGNIVLRNSGKKTLISSLTVLGNLTIENGATFDADSNTITLSGSWIDNGGFVPSTGTVVCAGDSKNISGNTTFNKLTVTGSYTILNDVTFNRLLNITKTGSLTGGANVHTTMNGDLINSGVLYTLGTTTYSGNVVQTLSLINAITTVAITVNFNGSVSPVLNSTSAPQFGYLNINNTGGINPSVGWTVLYGLNVGAGASFNGGVSTHNIIGSLTNNGTITSSGTINFLPTSAVNINLGTGFSSTGTVVWGGTGAISLTGTPAGFRNVTVSNTNISGITPSSDWNISNNLTINSGSVLNAGSGSFQVGGNIVNAGTLNSGTSSFLLNGAGLQEINTASPFYNITLNKTAGLVSLSSDVTVNANLNFISGKIQTGGRVLLTGSSASLTGAAQNTGWVIGNLRKNISTGSQQYIFEVGDSSHYTPCNVAFNNVTTAGRLTVFTVSSDHPQISSSFINASKSVNRYWSLNNDGVVFTSYDATFNFVETDLDATAAAGIMIAGKYSGGSWIYPTLGQVTSTSVQALGLTTLAEFQIGEMIVRIKTWDGGAGTRNWSDAANWNTDGVPTANDDVELTRADTINIDVAAVTKSLLINNANLILTVNDSKSLSVSGDFTLTAGVFNTAAAFPAVTGVVNVSGGTVGFTGTAAQTIPAYNYNNLLSSSTGSRVLANTGMIGIAGSFYPGNNIYTVTGSTVNFNGSGAQTIAAFGYDHLMLSNAGEKIFANGITQIGRTISVMGDATANTIMNSSTISYNGTAAQTAAPMNYYNLDAANAVSLALGDLVIFNDLTVSSGTAAIGTDNTSRTITLNGDLAIATGAVLTVDVNSDATHQLLINGNISNNGTLAFRADANSVCNTTFAGNGTQTIAGAGAVTDFNKITVDMGAINTNYVDMTASHFTAPDGFLTLKNGSFNLNSAGTTIIPFTADIAGGNTLIPVTAGLWVNAGTINSVDMNWTVAGLVKVSGGVLNMGNAVDNAVIPMSTSNFSVSGGHLVLASRISNPGSAWTLFMKDGEMTVNTTGSTAAGVAPFNMDAAAIFDMSGGVITIQNKGGAPGEDLGYKNNAVNGAGFTGGSLQIGNNASLAGQAMEIISQRPVYNLAVSSNNVEAHLETSDLAVANDVTVASGSLDINDRTLTIGGQISNSGSFIAAGGTIVMNGIAAQEIPAGAFTANVVRNLTISNAAGVSLNGTLDVTGILLAAEGTFNTGGHLTLVSTAAETALIDGSGAGEVLGNVTMQRYLASGFGYKYFSSPFQASAVDGFGDDLDLNAAFPSFYRYEEDMPSSGWINYTNPSGILQPFSGYAANFGNASAAKTVGLDGIVTNGTVAAPMLYNHDRPYTKGFHLVGNPYPSPINWDALNGWNKTNIDNAVYYFTNSTTNQYTGVYSSYINGISSDGIAGNIIPSMQGFFVHVTDGSFPAPAQLSITNAARTNDLAPVFHSSSTQMLRLSAGFSDSGQVADAAVIYLDNHGRNTFDRRYDALKLMNTNPAVPNLYAVSDDSAKISIRAMAYPNDSVAMQPLGLKTEQDGWITFNALDIPVLAGYPYIYLLDAKTNIYQDLKQHPTYRVQLKAGDHEGRFFIVFRKEEANAATGNRETFTASFTGGRLVINPMLSSTDKGTVTISGMGGQLLYKHELNGNTSHTVQREFASAVYVITVYAGKGSSSKKIFIGK